MTRVAMEHADLKAVAVHHIHLGVIPVSYWIIMTDLEFIDYISAEIIHEGYIVLFLTVLALYYFIKEIQTFDVTFLVLTQYSIDTILMFFYAAYDLAYIVSYATLAMTATYVSYRIHKRCIQGHIKITVVEVIILAMEAFIILSLCVRFIDASLLGSYWFSAIFGYVIDCCSYIILAALLTPFYIKIFNKLNLGQYIDIPAIQDKLLKTFYTRIPDPKQGE